MKIFADDGDIQISDLEIGDALEVNGKLWVKVSEDEFTLMSNPPSEVLH